MTLYNTLIAIGLIVCAVIVMVAALFFIDDELSSDV